MNKELTKKLKEDFPILYGLEKTKFGNQIIQTTFYRYGFELGDGWEPLIRKLSEELEKFNAYLTPEELPVQAIQVKEKLGGLRFYLAPVNDNIYPTIRDLINEAENKAIHICDVCGAEGMLIQERGWLRTRCSKHRDERCNY